MNSLWSCALTTPRMLAVPIPYMKDPPVPAFTCRILYLYRSFFSIGWLHIRTYQLPPPDFLKRLALTWTNLALWGLAESGVNFLFSFMASSCSFSSFHCLISFSSTKILLMTSSFCSRVFSNFLNVSVNFYICSSLCCILAFISMF